MKVLVLYISRNSNLRASQREHLFCFQDYADGHHCFYLNVFTRKIPRYFDLIQFDLVVFSWSLLGERFIQKDFLIVQKKIERVKQFRCPKIALPQDEFSNTESLCKFINDFGVNIVYSVSPESEWIKVYKTVDFKEVKFYRVLTGYLDEKVILNLSRNNNLLDRPVDIGFRSGSAAYWGRFNQIKFKIADEFEKAAKRLELVTDIAFGWQNFLMGDKWYSFLLRCKYIPGIEGGSSILDWDGKLVDNVRNYLRSNPNADFDQVEQACIPPGKDGEINVVALSPRHLEACVTKTCQVLVEGEYNGVLKAGLHYIPLKRDFSNLDQVMDSIKMDNLREEMVERAYEDIVSSGKYTYRYFANYLIENSVQTPINQFSVLSAKEKRLFTFNKFLDKLSWKYVQAYSLARDIRDGLKRKIS